ncbi:hypothetical protein KI387_035730 [Taxus chinensis]|uniref:Uncharacterized protein n=1 Tax=Taxus chinensis TaxID=29808 RepID=A0AA38KQU7_TAXCH|nr:hypothetical protein KI387_035730 [Taxus chinensis]
MGLCLRKSVKEPLAPPTMSREQGTLPTASSGSAEVEQKNVTNLASDGGEKRIEEPSTRRGIGDSAEAGHEIFTTPPSHYREEGIEQPGALIGSSGLDEAGHGEQVVSKKLPAEASIGEHGKATPPPTLLDVKTNFTALTNSSSVDELINEIRELLQRQKERLTKKEEASTSSQITLEKGSIYSSLINSGATFFKFLNANAEKGDARAIAMEMLAVAGNIHWLVAGLSFIAYLLGKFDEVSEYRNECLQLLESMVILAVRVKNLKNEIPEERENLEKVVECIGEGSIMCASQLYSESFFRFLKSTVNSESLSKLREKSPGCRA